MEVQELQMLEIDKPSECFYHIKLIKFVGKSDKELVYSDIPKSGSLCDFFKYGMANVKFEIF